MTLPNLLRRPLSRCAAVLAVATLGVALVVATEPGETPDAAAWEPYPPFRMTYMSALGSEVTVQLTWLGSRSWQTKVVSSPEYEGAVGGRIAYDGATYTSFSPLTGIETMYLSCKGDGWVPGPWFVPRTFSAEEGFEALGRGPDGYDHFLRVVHTGETEFRTLYKRDPASGLVMEVSDWEVDAYVPEFRVISLEILPESVASMGACDAVEILHLQPPPPPQPTKVVD